jgi:hypothetical protein
MLLQIAALIPKGTRRAANCPVPFAEFGLDFSRKRTTLPFAMIQIGDGIYIADGPLVSFFGTRYPTRSVFVKLASGDLWVWSPVQLTDEIKNFVASCGPVRHLVSPNKLHHLFLKEWKDAFPQALVWGPKATIRKCPDIAFQPALRDVAPQAWADEIQQFYFTGSPFLKEVEFFHKASRTAIFADLTQNFSDDFLKANWSPLVRRLAHFAKMTWPNAYAPAEVRWTWFRKAEDRKKLQALLALNPEKVVMAHGEWQNHNGREFLERAFRWLLSPKRTVGR